MSNAYLLTWNAAKWPWHDLAETAVRVQMGEAVSDRWNCSKTSSIKTGDRVFILKQGAEPRGIVGSGWVITPVFKDLHWNENRAAQGQFTNYINFEYDCLFDPQRELILDRDYLKSAPGLSQYHWDSRSSGVGIDKETLHSLEQAWSELSLNALLT